MCKHSMLLIIIPYEIVMKQKKRAHHHHATLFPKIAATRPIVWKSRNTILSCGVIRFTKKSVKQLNAHVLCGFLQLEAKRIMKMPTSLVGIFRLWLNLSESARGCRRYSANIGRIRFWPWVRPVCVTDLCR